MATTTSLVASGSKSNTNLASVPSTPKSITKTATSSASALFTKTILTPRSSTAASTPPTSPNVQARASPNVAEPGRWQHPRLDEIIRRQNRTRFDRDNMQAVLRNLGALAPLFVVPWIIGTYFFTWPSLTSLESWLTWSVCAALYTALWVLRSAFLLNISLAIAPLFRAPDACEDIPLDASQRQLLGLPPMSRPATPQEKEQYATPPRFSRSNTPQSATTSLRGNPSNSPLSDTGSPLSPYLQSPWGRGGETRRRLSYTSTRSSPLSVSEFEAAGNPITPTKNHRASIGLNSRWLYEKGRSSSGINSNLF